MNLILPSNDQEWFLGDERTKFGLFLDDERNPRDVFWIDYPTNVHWRVVRSFEEFCAWFDGVREFPDYVSFDHDLQGFDSTGTEEKTGYHCLKSLLDTCMMRGKKAPKCLFHTMNPIGKRNMEFYYLNYLRVVENKE